MPGRRGGPDDDQIGAGRFGLGDDRLAASPSGRFAAGADARLAAIAFARASARLAGASTSSHVRVERKLRGTSTATTAVIAVPAADEPAAGRPRARLFVAARGTTIRR